MKKLIPLLVAALLPAFDQSGVTPTIHSWTPKSTKSAQSRTVPAQLDATFEVRCLDCTATPDCRQGTLNVDGTFSVHSNDARKCNKASQSPTGLSNQLIATSKGNGVAAPNLNLPLSNINNQIVATNVPL